MTKIFHSQECIPTHQCLLISLVSRNISWGWGLVITIFFSRGANSYLLYAYMKSTAYSISIFMKMGLRVLFWSQHCGTIISQEAMFLIHFILTYLTLFFSENKCVALLVNCYDAWNQLKCWVLKLMVIVRITGFMQLCPLPSNQIFRCSNFLKEGYTTRYIMVVHIGSKGF
jgi:hypothetical protein